MKAVHTLLEWAFSSSFLILAVLALRALLGRRVSAGLRYALWAVVLVRLLVPVQVELPAQLTGSIPLAASSLAPEPGRWEERSIPMFPQDSRPIDAFNTPIHHQLEPGEIMPTETSMGYYQRSQDGETVTRYLDLWSPEQIVQLVWWAGILIMGGALLISNLHFARRLRRVRIPLDGADCPLPVYAAKNLPSPCLFGLIRPAVYVAPETAADPTMLLHVLAHESTHYRHGDHIWNLLRSAALALHWYNPLVWLAVSLSRRDCELACDERTLKRLGDGARTAYGHTLLTLLTEKPGVGTLLTCATTMTGGQKGVWERVTRIAHTPKRWLWAAVAAVLSTALACVCAFGQTAEPSPPSRTTEPAPAIPAPVADSISSSSLDFAFHLAGLDEPVRFSELTQAIAGTIEFTFQVEQYTILDLDRNGSTELILELEGQGGFLLLYQTADGLCGYHEVPRGLQDLKADGTYGVSSGAGDWGYNTVSSFTADGMEDASFTWCESRWEGEALASLYFVNGSSTTRQNFEAASEAQRQKDPAPWRPWTEENGGLTEAVQWLEGAGAVWLEPVETPALSRLSETELLLTYQGKETTFQGNWDGSSMGAVPIRLMDLNGDGQQEIAFSLLDGSGSAPTERLYLFNAETLEQYNTTDLSSTVKSYLSTAAEDVCFTISAPEYDFFETIPRGRALEIEDKKRNTLELSTYVMFHAWEDQQLACVFSTSVGWIYGYLGLEGQQVVCTGFSYKEYTQVGRQVTYADVLLWGEPFWCNSLALNAADIPGLFAQDDPYTKIWRFAVVDLDGDGTDEVLLYVCGTAGDMGGYLLLYQMFGTVCSEVFSRDNGWRNRWFLNLKTDGTFECEGILDNWHSVSRLFFTGGDGAGIYGLAVKRDAGVDLERFMVIQGDGSGEEYEAALAAQEAKPDAVWYDFTPKNIESLLLF